MRLHVAALLLRLPLSPGSRRAEEALHTVLRAAHAGRPAGTRAVARVLATRGPDVVWQAWLKPSVSGPAPDRWSSPLLGWAAGPGVRVKPGSLTLPVALVDAAWRDWLVHHDDALWRLLRRWNRRALGIDPHRRRLSGLALGADGAQLGRGLLVDTALRFDHPIGERARARILAVRDTATVDLFCAAAADSPAAAAFCVAHGLVPADEIRRAVFFLRTGQHEQYRAQDPDGTLLALGYRDAEAPERAALRTAMTALGDLDALRVLAGRRQDQRDFVALAGSERAFLVRRLADRRDFEGLWKLVPLMTLVEAVSTVRAFGSWRPAEDDGRRLFEALSAADPEAVRSELDALHTLPDRLQPDPLGIRTVTGSGIAVQHVDLSADGRQLAFVGHVPGRGGAAGIVDVPDRRVTVLHSGFPSAESPSYVSYGTSRVVHLGTDTILLAARAPSNPQLLLRTDRHGGTPTCPFQAERIADVQRVAGSEAFVVTATGTPWSDRFEYALFTGTGRGSLTDTGVMPRGGFFPCRMVVEPFGGRVVAVLGSRRIVVTDLATGKVNTLDTGPERPFQQLAAMSPTALVRVTPSGHLSVWYHPLTTTRPPVTWKVWNPGEGPDMLAFSCDLNRFLAVTGTHVELLAVPSAPDGPAPPDPVAQRIELDGVLGRPVDDIKHFHLRLSPRGDVLAVARPGSAAVDLYRLTAEPSQAVERITGPMGLMSRQDLAHVGYVQGNGRHFGGGFRQALQLLRACLEYRFRHDIGLGDAAGTVAAETDGIALGDGREGGRGPGSGPAPGPGRGGT